MSRWFLEPLTIALGDGPGMSTPEAMLASLNERFDQLAPRRGTRVACVIGGSAVRYRVVPWSDELSSPAERRTLAAHAFHEAYGDAARSWAVRETAVSYGRATLASAIDAVLLEAIETLCRERGLRLDSVQPSVMHAFNQHRLQIDAGLAWFVSIEASSITALLRSRHEALHVRQLASAKVDLAGLLDREWFALALDAPPCPAYVARTADAPVASGDDLTSPSANRATASAHTWRIIELPSGTRDPMPAALFASVAMTIPS